jgi:hypothetical protein
MRPKSKHPRHQRETIFVGELQVFTALAVSPDDPSLEPRVRNGRPTDKQRRSHGKGKNGDKGK